MVLSPSDYNLPEPGERMDPTSPMDFGSRILGMIVALSVVWYAWQFARNRGASFIDSTLGSLTGGILSSEGDAGPWEGV